MKNRDWVGVVIVLVAGVAAFLVTHDWPNESLGDVIITSEPAEKASATNKPSPTQSERHVISDSPRNGGVGVVPIQRRVEFSVSSKAGYPIRGAQIAAVPERMRTRVKSLQPAAYSDEAGQAAISEYPSETKYFVVEADGYGPVCAKVVDGRTTYSFTLHQQYEWLVTVLDENAHPVPNAQVHASQKYLGLLPTGSLHGDDVGDAIFSALTNERGIAVFKLTAGLYTAMAYRQWACWVPDHLWRGFDIPMEKSTVLTLSEAVGYAVALPNDVLSKDVSISGVAKIQLVHGWIVDAGNRLQAELPGAMVGVMLLDRARHPAANEPMTVHIVDKMLGRLDWRVPLKKCSEIRTATALPSSGNWKATPMGTLFLELPGLAGKDVGGPITIRATDIEYQGELYRLTPNRGIELPVGMYTVRHSIEEPFITAAVKWISPIVVGDSSPTLLKLPMDGEWVRSHLRIQTGSGEPPSEIAVGLRHMATNIPCSWRVLQGVDAEAWFLSGEYKIIGKARGWKQQEFRVVIDEQHPEILVSFVERDG